MNEIDVACAVIVREGRILVAMRGKNMDHAGLWEFPGGKVVDGETPEQALVRELKEELHITVAIQQSLTPVTHAYPHLVVRLIPFVVHIVSGDPVLGEHEQMEWYHPDDLPVLPWTDADIPVVMEVVDLLG